jgi:hypothetical protein
VHTAERALHVERYEGQDSVGPQSLVYLLDQQIEGLLCRPVWGRPPKWFPSSSLYVSARQDSLLATTASRRLLIVFNNDMSLYASGFEYSGSIGLRRTIILAVRQRCGTYFRSREAWYSLAITFPSTGYNSFQNPKCVGL